jgi:hypothetical protein
MTDVGRMSVGELVGKVLADEHADMLRQAVCWLAQQLMKAEVTPERYWLFGDELVDDLYIKHGRRSVPPSILAVGWRYSG